MLILARHGRTDANARRLLLGRLDPPLDELGRVQARRLAERLDSVSRVVTSPLRRARDTAAAFHAPITVDERWIELDYGSYDGMKLSEVPSDLWRAWRDDTGIAPPGGESLDAVGLRVAEACDELADEAAEADVVIVSHVAPIKAAVAWALGTDQRVVWRMFLQPASISRIATDAQAPVVHTFNETSHLDD